MVAEEKDDAGGGGAGGDKEDFLDFVDAIVNCTATDGSFFRSSSNTDGWLGVGSGSSTLIGVPAREFPIRILTQNKSKKCR